MENLKVNFNNQLTQITDKNELEKERVLIDVERNYQTKLQEVHESYNEKLARLYEKFEMKESSGKPKRQNKVEIGKKYLKLC